MQTSVLSSSRLPRLDQLLRVAGFAILALLIVLFPRPGLSSQVTIAWDPNSETEVTGYTLHYGTSSGHYTNIYEVQEQTSCTLSGLQAGTTYFFAATAHDANRNRSDYSEEISFTIPLDAQSQSVSLNLPSGWALLSIPVQLANPSIASVLAPITGKYREIWAYRNGQWGYYDVSDPEGTTLSTIDAGMAYWIKMASPAQLQISGAAASRRTTLVSGWNFVGYSQTSTLPIASALGSIAGKYDLVWTNTDGQWSYYDPSDLEGSTLTHLQPGRGYWIKMQVSAVWTLS